MIRMLERPRSFAYEVWAWKVNYLMVPEKSGCASCRIRPGSVELPLSGLSYSKSFLAAEVKKQLEK